MKTTSKQNIIEDIQIKTLVDDSHVQLSPQNFRIIKMIGRGGYGSVYLVKARVKQFNILELTRRKILCTEGAVIESKGDSTHCKI